MGNSVSMFEKGPWDPHPEVVKPYHFPETTGKPTQDMSQPLSHYYVSSGDSGSCWAGGRHASRMCVAWKVAT